MADNRGLVIFGGLVVAGGIALALSHYGKATAAAPKGELVGPQFKISHIAPLSSTLGPGGSGTIDPATLTDNAISVTGSVKNTGTSPAYFGVAMLLSRDATTATTTVLSTPALIQPGATVSFGVLSAHIPLYQTVPYVDGENLAAEITLWAGPSASGFIGSASGGWSFIHGQDAIVFWTARPAGTPSAALSNVQFTIARGEQTAFTGNPFLYAGTGDTADVYHIDS